MAESDIQIKDFEEQDLMSNPDNKEEVKNEQPRVNRSEGRDHEDIAPMLETPAERRIRRKSHYIIYLTILNMSIGFSIVLTGVWPYLKQLDPSATKEFLGWVVAANPIGQMLTAPLLGWWSNKIGSNRAAFMVTITLFVLGNALYGLLPLFKKHVKYIMMLSRFIVGVSSSNIAICRSYISASTKVRERTTAISITAAAQSMGFILGPSIQTGLVVTFMGLQKENSTSDSLPLLHENGIPWNMYSSVGWIVFILGIVNICLFLPCSFQEMPIAKKEMLATLRAEIITNESKITRKYDYPVIGAIIFAFFIVSGVFVLLQALMVPLIIDIYALKPEYAVYVYGIFLTSAATLCLILFLANGFFVKFIDERKVLLFFGFLPIAISMFIHFPMGNTYPIISNCSMVESVTVDVQVNFSPVNASSLDSDIEILSRSNRIVNESLESCSTLGCPSTQEWCFYTPIIEKVQLIIGQIFFFIGLPLASAVSTSIYSKLLGAKPQGVWMGLFTSMSGLARIIGPLIILNVYVKFGTRWTFGSLFVVVFFTFILLLAFYKRIVPYGTKTTKTEIELKDLRNLDNN